MIRTTRTMTVATNAIDVAGRERDQRELERARTAGRGRTRRSGRHDQPLRQAGCRGGRARGDREPGGADERRYDGNARSDASRPGARRTIPTTSPATQKTITNAPSSACLPIATRRAAAGTRPGADCRPRPPARTPPPRTRAAQTFPHPRRRMERRAEVRPGHLAPAHDELAGAKAPPLVRVEPLEVALAVRRQQHEAVAAARRAAARPSIRAGSPPAGASAPRARTRDRTSRSRTRAAARGRSSRSARTAGSRGTSRSPRPRGRCRRRGRRSVPSCRIDAAAAAAEVEDRRPSRSMPRSRALERLADRLAPRAGRSPGTTRRRAFPRRARSGAAAAPAARPTGAGSGACGSRAARTRSYVAIRRREQARAPEQAEERVLQRPLAPSVHWPHGAGARTSARVRAAARAAAPADRLRRPGRGRGTRGRAGEAVDQARGEAVRARPGDPLHGSDDARGLRHAGQGRGALLEGGAPRSDRPAHPVGRGRVRLPESRPGRGRAAARQRREGRVGRDRVPVRAVAARRRSSRRCAGSSSRAPTRSTW